MFLRDRLVVWLLGALFVAFASGLCVFLANHRTTQHLAATEWFDGSRVEFGAEKILPFNIPTNHPTTHHGRGHGLVMMGVDGPRVELSSENVARINRELAAIIQREAPGQSIWCSVSTRGVTVVDVNFSGNMDDALEIKLTDYCAVRVSQLVREQVYGVH
jgi:hypothetical protein